VSQLITDYSENINSSNLDRTLQSPQLTSIDLKMWGDQDPMLPLSYELKFIKLIQDLHNPLITPTLGTSNASQYKFLKKKSSGHNWGAFVTKKSKENSEYLIKVETADELIVEILGSTLSRFFLGDDAAKNKLILSSEGKDVYVISKVIPGLESPNETSPEFFNDPAFGLNKIYATCLLLGNLDVGQGNLGFMSSKNKFSIVDFGEALYGISVPYTDGEKNYAVKSLSMIFFSDDAISGQSQYYSQYNYKPIYSALNDVCVKFETSKDEIQELIKDKFDYLAKYIAHKDLNEFFGIMFEVDYENPVQASKVLIEALERTSSHIKEISHYLELHESLYHRNYDKVRELLTNHPHLLYEKLNLNLKEIESIDSPEELRAERYFPQEGIDSLIEIANSLAGDNTADIL
jgi:hypothetical protein